VNFFGYHGQIEIIWGQQENLEETFMGMCMLWCGPFHRLIHIDYFGMA
jgi:hypothetical protein